MVLVLVLWYCCIVCSIDCVAVEAKNGRSQLCFLERATGWLRHEIDRDSDDCWIRLE